MTTHRLHRLALSAVAVLAFSVISPAGAEASSHVECIAHRGGATTHTEETSATYTDVLVAGVAEIEGDIRWNRTGYPMMLHDTHLGKFGRSDLDLVDLSTGEAKSHVSASGDVMMTLYELRTLLLAYPSARLQLEIKEATMTEAKWDMLASRIAVLGNRVTVTSFSLATVRQAQDRGYKTGLLASVYSVTTAAPVYAQSWTTIESDDVAAHLEAGVTTQAWTADTETAWNSLRAMGVRTIITNKPLDCMAWSATPLSRKK